MKPHISELHREKKENSIANIQLSSIKNNRELPSAKSGHCCTNESESKYSAQVFKKIFLKCVNCNKKLQLA